MRRASLSCAADGCPTRTSPASARSAFFRSSFRRSSSHLHYATSGRNRDPAHLSEACFVFMAAGWSIAFLLMAQPWGAQVRYFLVALPLVSAAAIPRLSRGRGRFAVVTAVCAVALVVAVAVTASGPDGVRRGEYRRRDFGDGLREDVMSWWTRCLPEMYPGGATLGIAPEYNDTVFHLFRSLPQFRFLPVAEEEIPAAIAAGRLEGALTGQFRNPAGQGVTRPGRPLPRSFLHPRQADSFFRLHPDQYRLHFDREGSGLDRKLRAPRGPRVGLSAPSSPDSRAPS